MKTVFIIAGFDLHDTASDSEYDRLKKGLKNKDYNVAAVDINWLRKTPSQYVEKFISIYKHHKTDVNILIGNSFGAVIAFLAASAIQPDTIYLCSLSPFFKEDRHKFPDSYAIKIFGKHRAEDLWSYSADEIAEAINHTSIKTFVLYGEKEHVTSPALVSRCQDTANKVKNSSLVEIAGAPHNMSDSTYSDALINML